ncbi:MAG: hypothetical protein MI723_08175, partial [Caulobacterales bacterium]|nr:hypothetical protein [Caulobacterales bacterium]
AGIAALFAFWRPTTVAVDAFARGVVAYGRFILPLGIAGCAAAAWFLAALLGGGDNRSFYEIAPDVLASDTAEAGVAGAPVAGPDGETRRSWQVPPRAAVHEALSEVRWRSSKAGLNYFADTCRTEEQLFIQEQEVVKYCFVSGEYLTIGQCCEVKKRFRTAVNALHAQGESLTAQVHRVVMPVKIFFLLVLVGVGVMLVNRRETIQAEYADEVDRFTFSLALGGLLMLHWPLMNSAYTLSYDIVFGDESGGAYRTNADLYTIAFAVWALMLVFYQLRSYPTQFETAAKMGGLVGAAVGVLSYESIIEYLNRELGIGASVQSLTVWGVGVALLVVVFVSRRGQRFVSERLGPKAAGEADPEPSG